MTENYQPVYRLIPDVIIFKCLKTDEIKMGDMVYWDSVNKIARPLNGMANIATLLGVSKETNQVAHHGPIDQIAVDVMKDKIVRLKIKDAEAIDQFVPVYWGGDAQTVTTIPVDPTDLKIGYIMLNFEEGDFARTVTAGERVYVQMVRSYAFAAQSANI